MRSNVWKRTIFNGILITLVVAILESMTPSISAARSARNSHGRAKNTAPARPSVPAGDAATAEALKRQNEIMVGLQVQQSALERVAADSNSAIQRGMTQLKTDLANSRAETQQLLQAMNQRIDSLRRWLKFVVVFFLLTIGGLLYAVFRPVRTWDNSFKRRNRTPAMSPAEGEFVGRQRSEAATASDRTLGLGNETELASARSYGAGPIHR